jgi:hypothetical protein
MQYNLENKTTEKVTQENDSKLLKDVTTLAGYIQPNHRLMCLRPDSKPLMFNQSCV